MRVSCSLVVGLLAALPVVTGAATVEVAPGPGTPLQAALAVANPGDTLLLLAGTFTEAITLDKPIRLRGAGPLETVIDAGCAAAYAADVTVAGVRIESLTVQGGTVGGVHVGSVGGARLRQVRALAFRSVPGQHCGTEQYGIDVDGGAGVQLDECSAVGTFWEGDQTRYAFGVAGIRVRGPAPPGRITVKRSSSVGNPIGILLENLDGPRLRLVNNVTSALAAGLLLRNTRGATGKRNDVVDAEGSNPAAGIRLDAASSGNRLVANFVRGAVADVLDEGSGNCWRRNDFVTGALPADNCS